MHFASATLPVAAGRTKAKLGTYNNDGRAGGNQKDAFKVWSWAWYSEVLDVVLRILPRVQLISYILRSFRRYTYHFSCSV